MMRGLSRLVAGTACVGFLAVTGCGTSEHIVAGNGAEPSSTPGGQPSPSITPRSSPPDASPSSSPSTTTATPVDPRRVEGAVYSFTLPPGWHDESDAPTGKAEGVDVFVTRNLPSGHVIAITVITTGQQVLPSELGSPEFRADLLKSMTGPTQNKVVAVPDVRIDGELAVGVRTTENSSGQEVMVTLYMPTRFYLLYPVLLASVPADRRVASRALRAIIASWRWAR
jgi:hypothetical protein